MSQLIISVSGLRGIVGKTLTPEVVVRYAAAYATTLSPAAGERPRLVLGRDGRDSGSLLCQVAAASLAACGCEVLFADVVATPTLGVLVRQLDAAGGLQVTASHNPPPYNGIKLFAPAGRVLDAGAGEQVRQAYRRGDVAWVSHDRLGSMMPIDDPDGQHLQRVLATVDPAQISRRRFRVLLDSNHGAGSRLGQRLLQQLGCDVVMLGGQPDGQFEHAPEPTADNLRQVAAAVAQQQCDVGFCQDPDADRLALIDAAGRYVGEEYTLALCVRRLLDHPAASGPIVINGATSGISQQLAAAAGLPLWRSAVGEANVVDMMLDKQAAYGGEGNGGPIDPRVGWVRDSFVGIAQVLDLMASSGRTLAELVDQLPQLAIHKMKLSLPAERLDAALHQLANAFPDAEVDRRDGLRLSWPDAWLLVRGSNTEPIARVIAEAPTGQQARQLCQAALQQLAAGDQRP